MCDKIVKYRLLDLPALDYITNVKIKIFMGQSILNIVKTYHMYFGACRNYHVGIWLLDRYVHRNKSAITVKRRGRIDQS